MSQTTMIAMLEEAEDVLRRAGCDMTADKVRGVLQAQQAEPRCACGDSFTSDAMCANYLAYTRDVPVARDVLMALARDVERELISGGYVAFSEQEMAGIVDRHAAQPPAVAVAVPEVWRDAMERAAEDLEDNNCLESAHQLRAMLAAAPQAVATTRNNWLVECPNCGVCTDGISTAAPQGAQPAQLPPYDSFSDDGGESWRDHPADCDFVDGMQLGEEFELLGGWKAKHLTFRVTKVPDDESYDYEVEEVTAPAAAQKGGA